MDNVGEFWSQKNVGECGGLIENHMNARVASLERVCSQSTEPTRGNHGRGDSQFCSNNFIQILKCSYDWAQSRVSIVFN